MLKRGLAGTFAGRHAHLARLLATSTVIVACACPAAAQDSTAIKRNLLGSPGLVDMPSARMAPDGELSIGASFFENTQHYNFDFQALPWLQTSFRYSGLSKFHPDYPVYYDRAFAVKIRLWNESDVFPALAIGANDVVGSGVYGSEFLVASKQFGPVDATLGMGWGRLSGTGEIKNPLGIISSSYLTSRGSFAAGASDFSGLFHGPRSGIFGGLAWQTPIDGLVLAAEYSSDTFSREAGSGNFKPSNQYNFSAQYEAFDTASLQLDWLYGRALGAGLTFPLNPVGDPFPQRIGTQPLPAHFRDEEEQRHALNRMIGHGTSVADNQRANGQLVDFLWGRLDGIQDVAVRGRTLAVRMSGSNATAACAMLAQTLSSRSLTIETVSVTASGRVAHCPVRENDLAINLLLRDDAPDQHLMLTAVTTSAPAPVVINAAAPSLASAYAAIRKDTNAQDLAIQALSLSESTAIVYYSNFRYLNEKDALDRLVRVLMQDAPPDVERFRLFPTIAGVPQREFDVLRAPTERVLNQTGVTDISQGGNTGQGAPMRNPVLDAASAKNYPRFAWSIFPQFRQQLFDPNNPFAVQFLAAAQGSVEILRGLAIQGEVEGNLYDTFTTDRPPDSVLPHVRTDFAQYFTKGKNGIGNLEVDYRFRLAPSVFAIARAGYLESMYAGAGGEVLWRPENERWALGADFYEVQQRNFDRLFGLQDYRIFTGHVALYYSSPWYGFNFAIRAGQYLAGDRGITFEATRRFDSGVEIGAFFTRTNVSAERFGEGSFDKGIMIRIPLGWIAPLNTQAGLNMDLRPVQRDGGQRLLGDAFLYEETRRSSLDEILRSSDVEPAQ